MRITALAVACALGLAACGDDSGPPDARLIDGPPEGGTISLSWVIQDPDGNVLTCDQVGTSIITLDIIPVDQPFGSSDVIGCASGTGTSRPIAPGLYDVRASLGGVDAAPVEIDDILVQTGQDTAIGEVTFQVAAVGGFSFRISAGGQGNCTPEDQGGAGITATQIELQRIGGGCVPVTFDIAAGASQPASTYTTDCTTPAPHVCIAQDQTVLATPTIPTGPYRMTITGFVGGAACWSRVAQFDVPAGASVENLPQQNLMQDPSCAP